MKDTLGTMLMRERYTNAGTPPTAEIIFLYPRLAVNLHVSIPKRDPLIRFIHITRASHFVSKIIIQQ